ncbi:glycosyltransferase family 4 protein [Phycicoccus sp. HDW14]|uniref:glycosyltransferase n=1 Tax=Phycicoccus sp. HDW14 TaxID=2714941 RepID=UPI0014076C76|nr:glycosyltransferase [Phycicoccus sp. HDW14]QIM21562.1 glycosyltransferase family 4 protein [Phycicoccus sp. HDW14]
MAARPLVLYGMTSGVSAQGFIRGQAPFLRERGWDVALTCSDEADVARFAAGDGIVFHPVPLERNPSVLRDLGAAWSLFGLLRRLRPDVTLWGSPKASLLGVAACRVLRVPSVYVVHGLRLEGASGLARRVLTLLEAATCRLADVVVADGFELRRILEDRRIVRRGRVVVLADGSCNGVGPEVAAPATGTSWAWPPTTSSSPSPVA